MPNLFRLKRSWRRPDLGTPDEAAPARPAPPLPPRPQTPVAAMEARLRALEIRLDQVAKQSAETGEVVVSMLQRDLQTAGPAVARALDRVGLLVRRVLPQAAPSSSGLVWLANRGCDLARLPMGNVVKIASFLHLYCNSLARVAAVFAFPQPNLAGRSVASYANRRRGPSVTNGLGCWLDASDSGSILYSGPYGQRVVSVWRDLSGCGIDAVAHDHKTSHGACIGGLPAVRFTRGDFMTASDVTRVRTIAMVFDSSQHALRIAMIFAKDKHTDFSLRIVRGLGARLSRPHQNDFDGHPGELWVNGESSRDPVVEYLERERGVPKNSPVVVVCVKRAGRSDDDKIRFQLSSQFKVFNGVKKILPLGEVLVYDRELSADEALRTTEYLGKKWGIVPEIEAIEIKEKIARDRRAAAARAGRRRRPLTPPGPRLGPCCGAYIVAAAAAAAEQQRRDAHNEGIGEWH